jgi:asparagine synthase (glutamine-hydrolysing)
VDSSLVARRWPGAPPAGSLGDGLRLTAAFRRLAIRDLSTAGAQPMRNRAGTRWILHNGEIYNDGELRQALRGTGRSFESDSDAETILAAYEAWGLDCFERLRGMWAVILVDLVERRIVLSRDRLGIKPLFYARDGERLVAGSLASAVAKGLQSGPRIDPVRWHRFLSGLPASEPNGSFFAGVSNVPAGHLLSFSLDGPGEAPARRRFWSLDGVGADPAASPIDTAEAELRDLLETSTREHLVSDRTVGSLLSGGLDSSLVTCIAARSAPMVGCSIVYDDPRMSEWPYIQAVAAHAGVKAVTHTLGQDEAVALVDRVVLAQGEPLLGQDTIAHYRAFQLAREHDCVVVLEGQGADELFAGLPSYENVMFREWVERRAWRRLLREARLRAAAEGVSLWSKLRLHILRPAQGRWGQPGGTAYSWLAPAPEGAAADDGAGRSHDPSLLNRYLFDLVTQTNVPAVMLMQDRNAMAHGVENRPPFLDHRLVEWAFRQPAETKVSEGRRKRVVWGVARGILPPLVLNRRDKRAIVSRADWLPLRTHRRSALAALAEPASWQQVPLVDPAGVARFVQDYLESRHADHMGVWRLFTAASWLGQFRPSA